MIGIIRQISNYSQNLVLTLSWRRSLSHRNQSTGLLVNQSTSFHMIETSVMKELRIFSTKIFLIRFFYTPILANLVRLVLRYECLLPSFVFLFLLQIKYKSQKCLNQSLHVLIRGKEMLVFRKILYTYETNDTLTFALWNNSITCILGTKYTLHEL